MGTQMKTSALQGVLNHILRGLAAQGWERSIDRWGDCAYRGGNGRKCAAGHCILDREYSDLIEGSLADEFLADNFDLGPLLRREPVIRLVGSMQGWHDNILESADTHGRQWALEHLQARLVTINLSLFLETDLVVPSWVEQSLLQTPVEEIPDA